MPTCHGSPEQQTQNQSPWKNTDIHSVWVKHVQENISDTLAGIKRTVTTGHDMNVYVSDYPPHKIVSAQTQVFKTSNLFTCKSTFKSVESDLSERLTLHFCLCTCVCSSCLGFPPFSSHVHLLAFIPCLSSLSCALSPIVTSLFPC